MIFHWPKLLPEPQGHSRRAHRRRSAENAAMGGYLNLDGSYNDGFQKAIANEPLPQPVNLFGRSVLPKRDAHAPRYEKLGKQLRDNRSEFRRIPKGEDDSLANIIGKDADGNDIFAPPGYVPLWDDDMETLLGHMDWQKGIAVPLGQPFPSSKEGVLENSAVTIPVTQEESVALPESMPDAHSDERLPDQSSAGESEPRQKMEEENLQPEQTKSDSQSAQPRRAIPEIVDKRADEDMAMWEARKNWQDRVIQSNAHDIVFERGKSDFDALAATGKASVTQGPEYTAEIAFGENASLADLDSTGAARLADRAVEDPAILDALRRVAEGSLDIDEIDTRLNELRQLSQSSSARAARRRGKDYLGPERRNELARLTVLKGVAEAKANGATEEEVGQLLINGFAPDRSEDLAVVRELFLDMLPIIGEIRSARDAVENFDAMVKAIEAGDWDAAAAAGLFTALDAAGAVPLVGRLTKLALPLLKRGLVGKLIAQNKLAEFEKQFNNAKDTPTLKQKEVFAGIESKDPNTSIENLLGLRINQAIGRAAELEVFDQLERGGFNTRKEFSDRTIFNSKGKAQRIYDATTPDGVKRIFGFFLAPEKSLKGTAVEAKSGGAGKSLSQQEIDKAVKDGNKVVGKKKDDNLLEIGEVLDLRVRIDQINPDHLRTEIDRHLDAVVKKGKLDQESADLIRNRIMALHKQSNEQSPIPLYSVIMGLRAVTVDEE